MSETKHSPLPWTACKDGACPCGFVWDASGDVQVASFHDKEALGKDWYGADLACSPELREANTKFMLRAVNAHDDLVAALEDVLGIAENSSGVTHEMEQSFAAARAALSKARQQP